MTKEKTQGFSLEDLCAAVIGVGGLGCSIAVHLAGAGIGRLLLFDFDKISESNLNRQFLYTENDIGKKKVFIAKKRLSEYAPDCEICAFDINLTKDNIPPELSECDIIFLAADNKSARTLMSDYAAQSNIPLMLGGIDGFYGKTYLYIPGCTPCPYCAGMTDGKKAQTNISAAAGVIGSIEASTGIQYLITKNSELGGRLTVYDCDSFGTLVIKPDKKCKLCNILIKKEETR